MLRNSVALAVALAPISLPAHPGASVTVRTQDLDLRTDAGRATLDTRLERTAKRLCSQPDMRQIKVYRTVQTCLGETLALARQKRDRMFQSLAERTARQLSGQQ